MGPRFCSFASTFSDVADQTYAALCLQKPGLSSAPGPERLARFNRIENDLGGNTLVLEIEPIGRAMPDSYLPIVAASRLFMT